MIYGNTQSLFYELFYELILNPKLEELIAASRYGMIRASHKFDKSRGFTFAAYAVWWMREAILQAIHKKDNN